MNTDYNLDAIYSIHKVLIASRCVSNNISSQQLTSLFDRNNGMYDPECLACKSVPIGNGINTRPCFLHKSVKFGYVPENL